MPGAGRDDLPVRIYSLAKELKLDSKELVDLCPKAGVTGKGSALASLSDEEVDKIKAFVAGGAKAATATATAPTTKPGPTSAPAKEPPTPASFRREDYIAPTGTAGGKPPVLGLRPERPTGESRRRPPSDGPKPPPVRVAAMPTPPAAPRPKSDEPAPQKPDIKLPADAIRAGKFGTKPLEEHLRKHEERRKSEAAKGKEPAGGRAPAAPRAELAGPLGSSVRDRGRRTTGAPARAGEADREAGASSLGGREQRQLKRKRSTSGRRRGGDESDDGSSYSSRRRMRRIGTNTAAPRKTNVVLELPCTVRSFSEAIGIPARQVLGKLLALGNLANINSQIDAETAELLSVELGVEVDFRAHVGHEEEVLTRIIEEEDAPESLQPRPAVVTFLGHVDHGKTSLLDRIIGTNVVSGESGGITQHIRAYRIESQGRPIAFVDTPGHEAFTEMRARGANVTDIAVLVVAADDGVMPQTEEAISHARAAGVPIVVALNKIDLPGVNIDRVFQQLAANELLPAEWGGETEVVRTSAISGEGIDDLVETLLTITELSEVKANPHRTAVGTCLEAELHEGRGVVAKLLVQKGTLHVGDVLFCGTAFGRVKAMYDTLDPQRTHESAGPSTPVNVTGLSEPPNAGEKFYVLPDIAEARELAESRANEQRQQSLSGGGQHVTLENLLEHLGESEVKTLNLILRADTRGSIEAIKKEFGKLLHPEVQLKLLQATVGGVSEADVHLADASDAVIIGFNVVPDEGARSLADRKGVQVRRYEVIYKLTEDLKSALEGMLKPEQREVELGRALVQRVFTISRIGTVAGCRVLAGKIERASRARLIRDSRVIGDYPIESLRREKDDTREVREGMECGIKLAGYDDIKEGDVLEAYKMEEVARSL